MSRKIKIISLINMLVLIINIMLVFSIMNNKQSHFKPELDIYDKTNDYVNVQPLLISFKDYEEEEAIQYTSERKMNQYLQDKDNIIHVDQEGLLKLDFLDIQVYNVEVKINEKEVGIIHKDGQYFIEKTKSDEPVNVEVVSKSKIGIATYVFVLEVE